MGSNGDRHGWKTGDNTRGVLVRPRVCVFPFPRTATFAPCHIADAISVLGKNCTQEWRRRNFRYRNEERGAVIYSVRDGEKLISSSPLRDVVNSFNRYLTTDPWIGLKEPAFRTITCNLGNNGKRRVWVLYLELNINFWGILLFAILFFLLRLSLAPFPSPYHTTPFLYFLVDETWKLDGQHRFLSVCGNLSIGSLKDRRLKKKILRKRVINVPSLKTKELAIKK